MSMPKPYLDITGQRFGRWTVLKFVGTNNSSEAARFLCRCDCGREKERFGFTLRRGESTSCGASGCRPEYPSGKNNFHHKHGCCGTSEYDIWSAMRQRCSRPSHRDYPSYGGRGIFVCARWDKFENFLADMGLRPSPQHSLDRINNDGPYSPENCRWTTIDIQLANRRTAKSINAFTDEVLLNEINRRGLLGPSSRCNTSSFWSFSAWDKPSRILLD